MNVPEDQLRSPKQNGASSSRTEILMFGGLLIGWAVLQAFVLPKPNPT